MSRVYLASDLKLPGKCWAIKESAFLQELGVSLEEEAALLISLNHHRLPRIADFFRNTEGGYAYLVMDYVDGIHLDQHVMRNRKNLTSEKLAGYGQQICEGLHYLHSRQPPIIHRDLKPSNLLIDDKEEIRFIDFGIARRYKQECLEDTVKLGTVGFAAPEQYGGQSESRSDLYSLGAVLLYLGSGCQYVSWTEEAARELQKQGLSALQPVISRLLQQDPDKRYRTAAETGQALEEVIRSLSSLPSTSRSTTATRWGSKIRRPARSYVIAVMGSMSGVGVTHTSIALAHALSGHSGRVAIVEMDPKSTAFQRLARIEEGRDTGSRGGGQGRLRIKGVDYIRAPSRMELLDLISGTYEFVIADLGSSRRKELMEEFSRADLSLFIVPAAKWRHEDLMLLQESVIAAKRNLVCCVPMAAPIAVKHIRKMMGLDKVFALPVEHNPFSPGIEMQEALSEAGGDLLLPMAASRARSGFLWNRKR